MKKYLLTTAAVSLVAGAATAGGIDRSGQRIGVIFAETGEMGSYAELSFGSVGIEANGSFTNTAGFGGASGTASPLNDYTQLALGFKQQLTDEFSLSLIYEQPFGADVEYDSGPPFFGGLADIESDSFTVLGRYEFGNGFSVHGGIRALALEGEIFTLKGTTPAFLSAESDYEFGTVIGAAYERPDIALRIAVTYSSAIDVEFDSEESSLSAADPSAPPAFGPVDSSFDLEFPESVNIDFQTGVAQDTLVFGTIRWVAWDGFNLTTDGAGIPTAPDSEYVNFDGDTTTITLGVGRRITEELSIAVSYTYEAEGDNPSTTALAPTTGLQSISVGGSYDFGNGLTVSGGVTYGVPGDQQVETAAVEGGEVDFDDNEVIGVGIRVGFAF
ncbi:MAG: outer membrane protein transport protein [Pseudomonadota bacterium]